MKVFEISKKEKRLGKTHFQEEKMQRKKFNMKEFLKYAAILESVWHNSSLTLNGNEMITYAESSKPT